jgi:hypothetical protein
MVTSLNFFINYPSYPSESLCNIQKISLAPPVNAWGVEEVTFIHHLLQSFPNICVLDLYSTCPVLKMLVGSLMNLNSLTASDILVHDILPDHDIQILQLQSTHLDLFSHLWALEGISVAASITYLDASIYSTVTTQP